MRLLHHNLPRASVSGESVLIVRLLVLPVLLLWTAVEVPRALPIAVASVVAVGLTLYLRIHDRWPCAIWRGHWIALWVELALPLMLPLVTGGWRSLWLFDAWIVFLLVARQANFHQLIGLLMVWLSYALVLAAGNYPYFSDLPETALLLLSVPMVLAIRQPAPPSHVPPDKRLAVPLQTILRRFEQIKADLGPERAGYEATTLLDASLQAGRGIRETTALLTLIVPDESDSTSIGARLQGIITRWHNTHAITVEWTGQPPPRVLPPLAESILVRALEEALANVKQHANATNVEVELRTEDDNVLLTVRDNGVGLVHGTIQRPGSHGLRSLRYRVQEINGQMEVYEGVDGGLVVQLSVPLTVYAL